MASVADVRSVERLDLTGELLKAILSTLIGVGIFFLVFLARPEPFGWRLTLYGALSGLLMYVCCRTLHLLVGEPIHRRLVLPRPLVATVVFFFGGVLAWSLATLLSQTIGMTHFLLSIRDIGIAFGVAGSSGVVVGLVFHSFGRMQNRLRESVVRLKEAEFAEKELELARSIQARLLPPAEVSGEGFRVCAKNLPARFVAGDFYDVFPLADGNVGLVIADVSGKGIGSALIMASVKAVVPLVAAGRSAGETLTQLNTKLCAELSAREFVALAFARYDAARGSLEIANAGLPDPYLLSAGGRIEALSVPGPRLPLGARRDVPYGSLCMTVAPGERVLFVTDGLPEALTAPGEPLGYDALARLVESCSADGEGGFLDRLFDSVRKATTDSLDDDWTGLLLERY